MLNWHKTQLEWWMKKFRISYYGIAWISWIKGVVFGLFIYHFLIL